MKKDMCFENALKGNSSDTLLVIYILRILKQYSSYEKTLSVHDVIQHLSHDYSIGYNENADTIRKKVRRHLDTLHECYGNGCIGKEEGKTRTGHKWYYDASQDEFAGEEGMVQETLSDVELGFLIDLVSATKILNAESTLGMIDKLLKKTSLSDEERGERLKAVRNEKWTKNRNEDLFEKKEIIQAYMDTACRISFVYEGDLIFADPCGWVYKDSKCFLKANVGEQYCQYLLEKIQSIEEADSDDETETHGYYADHNPSNYTSLDTLFCNLPLINSAIKEKRAIQFTYRSYAVNKKSVVFENKVKNVLPHSLVFNDGKYYLIGIDEAATGTNKIGYFRVDLIVDLEYSDTKIKLSDWDKHVFEAIQKAREVERHPLMLAGREVEVAFLVSKSALDRVIDAFGLEGVKFGVIEGTNAAREKSVEVKVMTTKEEAFRWALANADAVELVSPQDVRDRLGRIADPIYQIYTQTLLDKVRENIDYIVKEGWFKIAYSVDENTAMATFKELKRCNRTGMVDKIYFAKDNYEPENYLGLFTNTKDLRIYRSPQCKNLSWAANFTSLETLHLTETQVDDVSWLKDMRELKWLEIFNSPVCDLSMLRDHAAIHTLRLRGTNIKDISFIENYQRLDWLTLIDCPIEDYSPLFRIPSYIKTLEIDKKVAQLIDIEKLKERHIGINIFID